ncbi:MAG: sensor domain-containing diguanylate cyclase, partial [Aeromonas sobria]
MVSARIGVIVGIGWGLLLLVLALPVWAKAAEEPIIITNSKAWQPFSFINESGQPDGLLID